MGIPCCDHEIIDKVAEQYGFDKNYVANISGKEIKVLIITFLPKIFGSAVIWHTFGIYEVLVLIVAFTLKKSSEQQRIVYK